MDESHSSNLEKEISISFGVLLGSIAFPLIVQLLVGRLIISRDQIYDSVFSGFLFFLIFEIFHFKIRWDKFSNTHSQLSAQLRQALNELETSGKMLVPLEFQGRPAHSAFSATMARFAKDIRVEDNEVTISGERVSRELYESFWDQIISAQKETKLNSKGQIIPKQHIKVFTTHSTVVAPWTQGEFHTLMEKQREFISLGGEVYRIFVRNPKYGEELSLYVEAINQMRIIGIKAYYIDPGFDNYLIEHDYLLVKFSEEYYYASWHTHPNAEYMSKNIYTCTISIGRDAFIIDHWNKKWLRAVHVLRSKGMITSTNGMKILNDKPSEGSAELECMKTLP